MAVHEVNMPGVKKITEPKDMKPQDATIDWSKKADDIEAQKRYELSKKELAELKNPNPAPPSVKPNDAGFTIKGGIDLGQIDVMAQQKDAQAKMAEIQKKYEDQVNALSQQTEDYRDKINDLKMQMMQAQFNVQLEALTTRLTAGQSNQLSFGQQLEMVKAQAGLLGLAPVPASVTDASLQLQILKMNNDAAREQREFEWKMEQYRQEREMRSQEVKENNLVAMEKVKVERERNSMLASGFEAVGAALARGIIDGGNAVQTGVAGQPAPNPAPAREYRIEARVGQQGQIACPNCGAAVAVLPDTEVAICAGCNARLPIVRKAVPLPGSEALAPEEAERAG